MRRRAFLLVGLAFTLAAIPVTFAVADGLGGFPIAAPDLPATSPPDEPIESKLTIKSSSSPGTQVINKTIRLRVFLAATRPYVDATSAVDASGGRVATVRGLEAMECVDADTAYTGTGDFEWCLEASGLQDGAEMTGVIATDEAILTLAFSVRDNFWGLPALVVLLGLALAGGWLWWTTRQLEVFVSKRYLRDAVNKNVEKKDEDPSKIEELDPLWIDQLSDRFSAKSLFQMVDTVIRLAPKQTAAAKERLVKAIAASRLPDAHSIKRLADAEGGASRRVRMSDFYGASGNPVTVHPIDKMTATVTRAGADYGRVSRTTALVHEVVPAHKRQALVRLVDHAKDLLERAAGDEGLGEAEIALDEVRHQTYEAAVESPTQDAAIWQFEDLLQKLEEDEARIAEVPSVEVVQMSWPSPRAAARGAIMGTVGAFALLAAATVASATYLPNATFGLWSDYLGLFLATVAASSVTGAVSALGLWTARKPLA